MIIKSLARKKPTFRDLLTYFHKEESLEGSLLHNLWSEENSLETVTQEFEENFNCLPPRKNGNALYHEIISLPQNVSWPREKQQVALFDLGQEYLRSRAPNQLAYGVIHNGKNHLHLHLCISSNEAASRSRSRLTKAKFREIQKSLEDYQSQKYPQLGQEKIYNKSLVSKRTKSREGSMKHHQRKPTQKMLIQDFLDQKIKEVDNHLSLKNELHEKGLRLYQRANVWGVEKVETGRRYRLKTLGLSEAFTEAERRWALYQERAGDLNQLRKQQDKTRERQLDQGRDER